MGAPKTNAVTLSALLVEIRNGYSIFEPVLISVHPDSMEQEETTAERQTRSARPCIHEDASSEPPPRLLTQLKAHKAHTDRNDRHNQKRRPH